MPDWYGVTVIKDRRNVADAHRELVVQLLEYCFLFLYSECVLPTFQDSLADCLLALFCPRGSCCTIMKRFWDHLSSCLHSLLFRGTYPLLNCKMQVVLFV